MDEDMRKRLDTADIDLDILDDIPDDVPDDIPEDIPEDNIQEDDIQEDDTQEDDIQEDDIQEDDTQEDDIQEDDTQEDDTQEDDIQEDDTQEDDTQEDDTQEDDTQEDDTQEDDTQEDDIQENDISEDIPADVSEDMPEDATTDDLYDGDTPSDIPEDVYSDGVDTEDDGEANDVPKEIPEDVSADADLNDPASADATTDDTVDDQSDVSADEATDDQSDVSADEATDDQSDVPTDEAVDNQGDVPADEADNAQLKNSKNDSPEYRMDKLDDSDISSDSFNSLSDYMNAHNYGPDDFATYSQDPEWRILHREAFPDYELPPLTQENAYNQLSDYMNTHNYGPDDFAAYSQDPIWRELHSAAFPDYELPEMTQESANAQLSQYMNDHNYEVDDYAEYSQDPIWMELHSTAFPDDELPPLQNMSEDEFTESSESGIPQSADTVNAEMAESAFNQELGREFEENILSDPELTPEQKELMLGNFDEANRSDISTENAEVQTGDLMSDILKPSHFDDTDSVSDIQEASPFNNAMEKSNSVIDRYEKVRNNTALMNDETGYQIAMNEMSKDLETQVTDIGLAISENDAAVKVAEEALRNYSPEMETSPLNDSKYRELVENLQNTRDQSNRLRSKKGYLESLKNEASAEVSNEFKEMTFRSPGGKSFTDTFSELINEQGAAYPDEIVNDCGVCTMGNMANQHGGKFTEKSGLSTGFGEYSYTQITDEMSPDEKAYALDHNGLTSLDSQANILNKMGYEAVKYENGASFDDIVDNISKGNSMSLNLYGRDLNSGSDIAKRPGRIAAALSGQQFVLPANHAVTIAGLAVNPSGKPIGFFVNDTGGYGGKNNPSIFVSKAKYDQMLKRTAGISSIVCTGKKVFA